MLLTKENLTLVIPDTHAHPDYDNSRFEALGNLIYEMQPKTIICLGDFADMPSLSSYDKGKKSFEGRRYKRDVEAALEAQELLFRGMDRRRVEDRKAKRKRYCPLTVHTLGNHDEARIAKLCELNPELDGTVSIKDLQYDNYWDIVVPFKETVVVDEVIYSHYFPTGLMGKPIGGDNPARGLLRKNHMSSVQGHSHYWDLCVETRADGSTMFGLVAGHYSHPDMIEGWNRDTRKFWKAGVHLFDGTEGQLGNYLFVSQDTILKEFKS